MPLKIALCTLSFGDEYRRMTKYSEINKQQYCDKHGYTLITGSNILDSTKTIHWSKIILFQTHMEQYDYIVWMDADLYIMNPEITLESFIERLMGGRDIMVGSDWKMSNTGVVFIKNTEWSKAFLQAWLNHKDFPSKGNYEQDAFQDLHEKNIMQASEHIIVSSPTELNSYWFNYYRGHFIIHMAGCRNGALELMMNRFCPVRKEDDSDESYAARMKWLEHQYRIDLDADLARFKKMEEAE